MKHNKSFYVATYGDMGIEIEFFSLDEDKEYEAAQEAAEEQHRVGDIDTYVYGEII